MREITPGDDAHDAGGPGGGLGVDGEDARVRMRRTHEMGMQRARHHDVVEIAALARQEAVVLLARQRLSDRGLAHSPAFACRSLAAASAIATTML